MLLHMVRLVSPIEVTIWLCNLNVELLLPRLCEQGIWCRTHFLMPVREAACLSHASLPGDATQISS
jgi:hypothetical protein